jgi:hypothetical protein
VALTVAELRVAFGVDDRQYRAGLNRMGTDLEKTKRSMGTAGKAAIGMLAALGASKAARSALSFLKSAVTGASDLNETVSKTHQIFGSQAARTLERWANGAAKSMGQSKQTALDAAATFGVFGKAAGMSGLDLARFAKQNSQLASDLASFHNTSPEEAIQAIGAAFRGEAEPIRKYGVLLDDASMRQQALKMGLIETTKEALTPQQKVLAAQALILKQTSDAQGDFARTSDGLANRQRILSAQWADLKARLGDGLLPVTAAFVGLLSSKAIPLLESLGRIIMGDVVPAVRSVTRFVADHDIEAKILLATIAALIVITKAHAAVMAVQAAGGLLKYLQATKLVSAAVKVWTALQWLLNAALRANPIGMVVTLLGVLVAAVVYAYRHFDTFRGVVDGAWDAIKEASRTAILWLIDKVLWMADKMLGAMARAFGWAPGIGEKLKAAHEKVKGFREKVNAELDAIEDEVVNVYIGTKADFATPSEARAARRGGGAGGHGGGFGGGPDFRVNTSGSATDRVNLNAREIAQQLASELATSGSVGSKGVVLPAGQYSIGMPYLGYPGHYGADYPAATGTPVRAAAGGVVSALRSLTTSYGKHIWLSHGNGIQTLYAHLNGFAVSPGQQGRRRPAHRLRGLQRQLHRLAPALREAGQRATGRPRLAGPVRPGRLAGAGGAGGEQDREAGGGAGSGTVQGVPAVRGGPGRLLWRPGSVRAGRGGLRAR